MNTAQQQFKNAISKHQNLGYTNVTFLLLYYNIHYCKTRVQKSLSSENSSNMV